MPCHIRLMCKDDIAQIAEIDREAFPTTWPPVNYRHELQNKLAHYIVFYNESETVAEPEGEAAPEKGFSSLMSGVRRLFGFSRSFGRKSSLLSRQYIIGFAGLWMMADEAHIINIAVRESYRRRGIGELLLIAIIDLAIELKAEIVTLEVRASNLAAWKLYAKYGFTRVGVRRGYYTDNGEDGILMSTENIASDSFQARFQQLRQAHSGKWGNDLRQMPDSRQLTGTGLAQPDGR